MRLHSRPGDTQALKGLFSAILHGKEVQLVTSPGTGLDTCSPLKSSFLALDASAADAPVATEPNLIAQYLGASWRAWG